MYVIRQLSGGLLLTEPVLLDLSANHHVTKHSQGQSLL